MPRRKPAQVSAAPMADVLLAAQGTKDQLPPSEAANLLHRPRAERSYFLSTDDSLVAQKFVALHIACSPFPQHKVSQFKLLARVSEARLLFQEDGPPAVDGQEFV